MASGLVFFLYAQSLHFGRERPSCVFCSEPFFEQKITTLSFPRWMVSGRAEVSKSTPTVPSQASPPPSTPREDSAWSAMSVTRVPFPATPNLPCMSARLPAISAYERRTLQLVARRACRRPASGPSLDSRRSRIDRHASRMDRAMERRTEIL